MRTATTTLRLEIFHPTRRANRSFLCCTSSFLLPPSSFFSPVFPSFFYLFQEGQTAAPEPETQVLLHFICFIEKGGDLYELDGCKATPINHGPIEAGGFLTAAAAQCQGFITRGQESEDEEARRSFSMVGLSRI